MQVESNLEMMRRMLRAPVRAPWGSLAIASTLGSNSSWTLPAQQGLELALRKRVHRLARRIALEGAHIEGSHLPDRNACELWNQAVANQVFRAYHVAQALPPLSYLVYGAGAARLQEADIRIGPACSLLTSSETTKQQHTITTSGWCRYWMQSWW